MTNDFDAVRRRRGRIAGFLLLIVAPPLLFLALLSFHMTWGAAATICVLAFVFAFGRWRLKEGSWPWQPPR
ncbi:hypothetical protein EF294_06770 [Gordonia oryzae]|uniref:Uncharacterized protein n=1 Tax=Gordonia oryzae TaxID=2487349 RepID=A0A3N4GV40_9ACTN|nr:hypothetical protein [Gordonia oryzae]RPA64808.1 hypothetical protein EF294_06770 [Gordonia oryzae]